MSREAITAEPDEMRMCSHSRGPTLTAVTSRDLSDLRMAEATPPCLIAYVVAGGGGEGHVWVVLQLRRLCDSRAPERDPCVLRTTKGCLALHIAFLSKSHKAQMCGSSVDFGAALALKWWSERTCTYSGWKMENGGTCWFVIAMFNSVAMRSLSFKCIVSSSEVQWNSLDYLLSSRLLMQRNTNNIALDN